MPTSGDVTCEYLRRHKCVNQCRSLWHTASIQHVGLSTVKFMWPFIHTRTRE